VGNTKRLPGKTISRFDPLEFIRNVLPSFILMENMIWVQYKAFKRKMFD
jgi:hypothetical protein